MSEQMKKLLEKLVVLAQNNKDHEAYYDLIGEVSESENVKPYIKELIEERLIENVVVYGHTQFSCTVTEKGMKYLDGDV